MDEKELQRLYNAVNSKFDIGGYDDFRTRMQTPEDRKKFYDVVGSKGFDLGQYPFYEERLSGVKKKENINVGSTPLGSGVSKNPVTKDPLQEALDARSRQRKEGAFGNISMPRNASDETATNLQQKTEMIDDNVLNRQSEESLKKENEDFKQQALETTAKRSKRTKEEVKKDVDEGKLILASDGRGNKIYARQPGAGEAFVRGLVSAKRGLADAAGIAALKLTGTDEELANYYEMISRRKKVESEKEFGLADLSTGLPIGTEFKDSFTPTNDLPTAAPTTFGSLTEMAGGLLPDATLAAATGGMSVAAKTAILGSKMYASSYGNKAPELYEMGKQELMKGGMDEKEASILAAQAATKNAATAAIPDAAMNTLFFSGKLHSPAANNFISVMKGAVKDAVKVGALGAATSATTSAIEDSQGYDIDGITKKMFEAGGEFAKLDLLFKVLPILRTLPKAAQSAVKEFAVDPVVKPVVENYLKTVPEDIANRIRVELQDYKSATEPIRGVVPEEKMASLGGRMQKRQNRINGINIIKGDIEALEAKKKDLPETLHEEINTTIKEREGQIKELEKEIESVDKEIGEINKSKETGLEKEIDEATGEPLIPKGEPEQISQPIELSTEVGELKPKWDDLSMAEKLKLAKENLPEVEGLSDLEAVKIADQRAKELMNKIEPETIEVEQKPEIIENETITEKPIEPIEPVKAEEVITPKETVIEVSEGGGEPPKGEEPKVAEGSDGRGDFDKMMAEIPQGKGEVKEYLSGETINRDTSRKTENDQSYTEVKLLEAAQHGQDIVEKAKEIFGDKYVEETLNYLDKNNISPDVKALAYVSLENAMEARVTAEPNNLGLNKLQDLVREKSQAWLRKNSIAINAGRLRVLKEVGFDLRKVTDNFFSPKEREQKANIEKLVQADAETIQKEYEQNKQKETSGFTEADIEAKVKEGVESEIAKIYESLPKEKKDKIDKDIAAIKKVKDKLKGKVYYSREAGFSEFVEKGIDKIESARKAGVNISDALDMGVEFIKEKIGDKFKEKEFRKDFLDGLKNESVLDAQQRRQAEKEYRMLETERNRQLARVADLTEKLKTLQGGERPVTNSKEAKPDVPEIEALKLKVKEETQKLNALDAQQRRIDGLETELERLQNRQAKEKSESVKREISDKEQELKDKIEEEKAAIRKENKENNQLRLSDAKDAVRQRIEKIKAEISNKERELKEKNKPLNEDLELTRLREIEKQITELRDKYLPEEKDPYQAEKQRERVKDKLVADIIALNEQINVGERNRNQEKPNYENDAEIGKLKKIMEAKKAILNEIDPLSVPKEKTTAERKIDAENNIQKRIDAIRDEILSGEREVAKKKDKLQSKKLDQLREQKKTLESLRDKYLPKGKDPYADKKVKKAVEDKLVKENIELNKQIAKGEKDIKDKKVSPESQNIEKLKAERDARKEVLEALDPIPKVYVENALIEQGFGKTIKVKTKKGQEERQVLYWKKLAGEEGSVDKISENIAKSLEKSGFTPNQLERMQDAFIKEYDKLRTGIVEKGLNEIARLNKNQITPEQKSAARRLSELYNYGLFDKKNLAEYEIVLNKALGISKLTGERIKRAEEIAKAMSTALNSTYQGKKVEQYQIRAAEQHIQELIRDEITAELSIASIREGGKIDRGKVFYKIADVVASYMDLSQMMLLNSVKNAVLENPISGYMENVFNKVANRGAAKGDVRSRMTNLGGAVLKEMITEKGAPYGDVTSTFVTRGSIERDLNKMTDNKAAQAVLSTVTGKTLLSGVDSYYKANNVERNFLYNLQKVLTQDRKIGNEVVKGMSKDEARNYIADRMSGQKYEQAQETAREIINNVNKSAGRRILNDSELFVTRMANDIIKGSLVTGGKVTSDMVTGSYEAAYEAAGRGLGHVANNIASRMIGSETGRIENKVKESLKNKDYSNAAFYRMYGILFKNILNPYVGGGMNWVFLTIERGGGGIASGLGTMLKDRNARKMDLTTEAGINDMKKALYANQKIRDKFIRGAVGGSVGLITALVWGQIRNKDEYEEWRKKNDWATKYTDILYPQVGQYFDAAERGDLTKQTEKNLNLSKQFDKGEIAWQAFKYAYEGKTDKAAGKLGQLNPFGAPVPWRLVRDVDQIVTGMAGGEPYKVPTGSPESFWEGWWRGGVVDYVGFAPKSESKGDGNNGMPPKGNKSIDGMPQKKKKEKFAP